MRDVVFIGNLAEAYLLVSKKRFKGDRVVEARSKAVSDICQGPVEAYDI